VATKIAALPTWVRLIIVITLIMFVINLVFFTGPLAALFSTLSATVAFKEFAAVAGTLFGTFIGAWFAFQFASLQRRTERTAKEVAAGNLALFTLQRMWEEIRYHQIQSVESYRNKPDAWLNLPVGPPLNPGRSFNVGDLSFVLQADARTFQEVILQEDRYHLVRYLIEEHRQTVSSQVVPALERAGIKVGDRIPINVGHFEEGLISTNTTHKLRVLTRFIISNIDEDEVSIRAAFKTLRAVLKTIHPEQKFFDFDPKA
jgi:hypothetical protein